MQNELLGETSDRFTCAVFDGYDGGILLVPLLQELYSMSTGTKTMLGHFHLLLLQLHLQDQQLQSFLMNETLQ